MTMLRFICHTFCGSFLASKNVIVIPHPPYSSNLAACDFFLLPKMKLKLMGWHFESSKKIQTKYTSKSASHHGNPTWTAVSMQKGTTFKGMEVNRNSGK
jgi:hypothetical protein